jgi:thiamine pyrophosphokinase
MNKSKIIAIIANGATTNETVLRENLIGVDILIAADGGAEICREFGIEPHYIVGDLDSVTDDTLAFFQNTKIMQISDQDSTDLEKSLNFAIQLNPKTIRVFCASGNRSDHLLSNFFTFVNYKYRSILEVFDDFGVMKVLHPGEHHIKGNPGDTISVFSFSAIQNLRFINFQYTPQKSNFDKTFCSISNVMITDNGIISFESGTLLIYHLF